MWDEGSLCPCLAASPSVTDWSCVWGDTRLLRCSGQLTLDMVACAVVDWLQRSGNRVVNRTHRGQIKRWPTPSTDVVVAHTRTHEPPASQTTTTRKTDGESESAPLRLLAPHSRPLNPRSAATLPLHIIYNNCLLNTPHFARAQFAPVHPIVCVSTISSV